MEYKEGAKIVWVPIGKLTLDERNPRRIKADEFARLKESIEADPGFMERRPCLVNQEPTGVLMIYAGEQRLKACRALKWDAVPCLIDQNLPQAVIDERMLRDNAHSGEWDKVKLNAIFPDDLLLKTGLNDFTLKQDEFQKEAGKHTDDNCQYPLVPKFSEKHEYVVILAETETDWAFLESFFQLRKEKSFKNTAVALGKVVAFDRFLEILAERSKEGGIHAG